MNIVILIMGNATIQSRIKFISEPAPIFPPKDCSQKRRNSWRLFGVDLLFWRRRRQRRFENVGPVETDTETVGVLSLEDKSGWKINWWRGGFKIWEKQQKPNNIFILFQVTNDNMWAHADSRVSKAFDRNKNSPCSFSSSASAFSLSLLWSSASFFRSSSSFIRRRRKRRRPSWPPRPESWR